MNFTSSTLRQSSDALPSGSPQDRVAVRQASASDRFDAAEHYGLSRWGDGYFHVDDRGGLSVSPRRHPNSSVSVPDLIQRLQSRGLQLPILLRFNDILRDRLERLNGCFAKTIREYGYDNQYRCLFPIKVNQQRGVVHQILASGSQYGGGVEAGSKAELLAAITMAPIGTPIMCNGFKDSDYVAMVVSARRLGHEIIPIVEKVSELDLILKHAERVGVRQPIGIRVKLASQGSGRWRASGGYRSKFGLTVAEVIRQLDRLQSIQMADCFQLLHFHVGSQIGDIRPIKAAIIEATRIYVELQRRGAGLTALDVGGGLGVDYDGSGSDRASSMNYSMQEYANDVVYHVQTICDQAGVDHPVLYSESGRAIAAHHSLLVVDTVGVTRQGDPDIDTTVVSDDWEPPIRELYEAYKDLSTDNLRETLHDAAVALELSISLFSGGYLPLDQRALAENLYFAICHRVRDLAVALQPMPKEFAELDRLLADTYFLNFSLFQSLPDAWAIEQVFPIVPIERLDEVPSRHAVLGDLTCDSDGKIDRFAQGDSRPHSDAHTRTIRLHDVPAGQSYPIAMLLVGAYQETLGDLHNLFGDTHAVHVDLDNGVPRFSSIVKGDRVEDVLGYVQFNRKELLAALEDQVETAVQGGSLDHREAGETTSLFERLLSGYTYLAGETE